MLIGARQISHLTYVDLGIAVTQLHSHLKASKHMATFK